EPVRYRGLPSRIQHLGARPGRDALAQFGQRAPPVARFGGRARRAVHHGDGGPDRIRATAAVGGGAPAAADRPLPLGPRKGGPTRVPPPDNRACYRESTDAV